MRLSSKQLNDLHSRYLEHQLPFRRFSFELFESLLKEKSKSGIFDSIELGRSIENKPIYHLSFGDGPISILVWTTNAWQ